ncbi:murein biosynthesis integral membrane protein MurJ [Hwanghaeella grinnelliae]|uniref:Probable lipid II flippase MurJ n=1 Tax=Hwanghaeella grinnelliae TaxID=2500179 RepID=A0A437QPA9_9PROT|nr:murein biosynthesis integral membrane protein MurJ [Hwanghaeella grinnelliae]RVU36315.1 murein biosynthesis integral membrane protein MurJ [Hwanghaeella grinnelliae]
MQLVRSIATVGGWTMTSRVLGFVRDVLIAQILGAGMVADAFFIAFKFPNLFRRLLGEGAMNAAFVPLYARRLEGDGKDAADAFAADVASVLTAWTLVLSVIAMAAMPWIMTVQAAGFLDQPEKFNLTVELARITFPYLLFMVLSAMMSGMLNSVGKFAAAAAAPVILNLVFITTLVLIHRHVLTLPGHALAVAVAIAGALQFAMLAHACHKADIMVPLPLPKLTPGVKRLLLLMAPGILGAGVVQINVMVGDLLATLLRQGSVSFLYYADRVNQLPLGVVGVAVGVALLPLLSRQLRAGEHRAAMYSMNRAIEVTLLLTLPAATALIAIPWPIVSTLFERGAFTTEAALATSEALRAYAIGLPAFVLIKALTPGFFAREDTRTPVKVAIGAVALNLILAVTLMQAFAHVGIALATSISAWANAGLLAFLLHRGGHFEPDSRLVRSVPRILLAAIVMAAVLWMGGDVLADWFQGGFARKLLALAGLVLAGVILFFGLAQLVGGTDLREVARQLRRRR